MNYLNYLFLINRAILWSSICHSQTDGRDSLLIKSQSLNYPTRVDGLDNFYSYHPNKLGCLIWNHTNRENVYAFSSFAYNEYRKLNDVHEIREILLNKAYRK
jgi:hypothetical protein